MLPRKTHLSIERPVPSQSSNNKNSQAGTSGEARRPQSLSNLRSRMMSMKQAGQPMDNKMRRQPRPLQSKRSNQRVKAAGGSGAQAMLKPRTKKRKLKTRKMQDQMPELKLPKAAMAAIMTWRMWLQHLKKQLAGLEDGLMASVALSTILWAEWLMRLVIWWEELLIL